MAAKKIEMLSQKIHVRLDGLAPIMFNRFIDYSKDKRPPEQKMYLVEANGKNQVVFPSTNIDAFLWGDDPQGCCRAFEGKAGKTMQKIGMGHIFIEQPTIPFTANNKPVYWEKFDNKQFSIVNQGGRSKQGSKSIKQEVSPRPVLHLPWSVEFDISIVKNESIDSTKLYNWFVRGGLYIALGAWRTKYGRFSVGEWDGI